MRVIGIGELVWDELPGGPAIGGAPLNVLSHLARLGHETWYLTAVGHDQRGDAAIAELRARGMDPSLVARVAGVPTGSARVAVGADGSPEFRLARPAAFEALAPDEAAVRAVAAHDPGALVFGTLAQRPPRVLAATRRIAAAAPGAVRLYDVNLRAGWWSPDLVAELAGLATVVKFSETEARQLAPVLGVRWAGSEPFSAALATRAGLRGVAVTAGPAPATVWLDGTLATAAPPAVGVADTVGAGDAFAAGLLDAIGRGLTAAAALRRAGALGALIASRPGAQPPWTPAELDRLAERAEGSRRRLD